MRRTRVVGPDEPKVQQDFYERATGHAPLNHTAFRQAERLYKKRPLDTTNLIDLQALSKDDERVRIVGKLDGRPVYTLTQHEGFLLIPQGVSVEEQVEMAGECMREWINPPNLSNLDAHYQFDSGFTTFLDAHQRGRLEVYSHMTNTDNQQEKQILTSQSDVLAFIKKIRWVTLGYHYDWTTKEYDMRRPPNPIPALLHRYSTKFAAAAHHSTTMLPEAGIINYYQPGDTLTGHVDRSEHNMSVPLVSISLGLSAVFLVGGVDRDDPVSAVLVRSGDVSMLAGPARRYYHGVPRVLEGTAPTHFADDPFLHDSRININLRQVH